MYPLHDNDLDRLSREAAEGFEVEPGASGWAHLEKRLDEELPQKKKRRRFLFWLFFITATTGGALTGILKNKPVTPLANNVPGVVAPADKKAPLQNNNSTAHSNTPGTPKNNTATTGAYSTSVPPSPATANPLPVAGNQQPLASTTDPTSTAAINDQPAPATPLTTTPDKNITRPVAKTKHKQPKPAGADKTSLTLNYATITPNNQGQGTEYITKPYKRKPGQQQRIANGKNNQSVQPVPGNTPVPDTRVATNDQNTNGERDNNPAPVTNQPPDNISADSVRNNSAVATPVADSTKTMAQEAVKKEDARKKDKTKQPLEIGLVAGPDMSTVAFGALYKTGYNFGLQVGYRFSDRWSVNTGIIYTKKFYQADSQHFHYKNPSTNWDLDKVKGNCSMWEIPVNVRYDVSFNDKRRWFVSTGLSTYLMDKEYYMMYYTVNGNPYSYPWDSDSNSSYFFSIWNLSAGMERSLGKHFSIQAEPYLKIPLQGLGHGNIRMESYGILFTLKYKPTFNAKSSVNKK